MMGELKPCPFCGGEASSTGRIGYSERHEAWWPDGSRIREAFFVNCMKCSCDNKGFSGHQTTAEAIAAWNRRPDAPSAGECEAVRLALTEINELATHADHHDAEDALGRICSIARAALHATRTPPRAALPAPPQADGGEG